MGHNGSLMLPSSSAPQGKSSNEVEQRSISPDEAGPAGPADTGPTRAQFPDPQKEVQCLGSDEESHKNATGAKQRTHRQEKTPRDRMPGWGW